MKKTLTLKELKEIISFHKEKDGSYATELRIRITLPIQKKTIEIDSLKLAFEILNAACDTEIERKLAKLKTYEGNNTGRGKRNQITANDLSDK